VELDINEINLELSFSLDTDQKRRSSSSSDNLIREVGRLEDESKRSFLLVSLETDIKTHELLDDSLDELCKAESLVGLGVPDVFTKNGDDFGIGLGMEMVSPLDEDIFELLV
jgi:hypothetical protein